jgi:hypothetical protein
MQIEARTAVSRKFAALPASRAHTERGYDRE